MGDGGGAAPTRRGAGTTPAPASAIRRVQPARPARAFRPVGWQHGWRGHPWLLARRLVQLYAGLVLYGVSMSLQVRAGLGLDPWDVFHQGLSDHIGLRFGTTVIVVGAAVLVLWIPLRQRPGLGTISNVVVIGLAVNVTLDVLPAPHALAARWAFLLAGVLLNGVAIGCYIGAGFGPGPRDGVMTGLAARGRSIRVVRTAMELTVLAAGFLLGGSVGIGTVVYAAAIGPLAHVFIPLLAVPAPAAQAVPGGPEQRTQAADGRAAGDTTTGGTQAVGTEAVGTEAVGTEAVGTEAVAVTDAGVAP